MPLLRRVAAAVLGVGAAARGARMAGSLPPHHLALAAPWPWPLSWLLPSPRFTNPWPTWTGDKKLKDLLSFSREMRALGAPDWGYLSTNRTPTLHECSEAFPLVAPDAAALAAPPPDAVQVTWLGHATLLLQLEGVTVLTDPVFSERASPLQFLGPRRAVAPALVPEDPAFPQLDAVIISHNHYDHLDEGSVARLHKAFGDRVSWYVPLGLKAWFNQRGVINVTEMDWWQEVVHPGSKVRLVFAPAQHWSARGVLDRRATLWGSWVLRGPKLSAWFGGDTGYCDELFQEIGRRLGPFDLSAIPIGAYAPRWFMAPMHLDPADAVAVHRAVRSRKSIGIHCCTFHLTLEPLDEPPRLLQEVGRRQGLAAAEFVTLRHGATLQTAGGRDFNDPPLLGAPSEAAEAQPAN